VCLRLGVGPNERKQVKRYLGMLIDEGYLIKEGEKNWRVRDFMPSTTAPPAERSSVGFVYVVRPAGADVVKIGKAFDVAKRLASLQTGQSARLELLAELPGGHRLEAELHKRFAHLRVRGEWFRAEPELLAYVVEVAK
jgi:hypothetical protein